MVVVVVVMVPGLWRLKLLGFHAQFAWIWCPMMGADRGLSCNVGMSSIWVSDICLLLFLSLVLVVLFSRLKKTCSVIGIVETYGQNWSLGMSLNGIITKYSGVYGEMELNLWRVLCHYKFRISGCLELLLWRFECFRRNPSWHGCVLGFLKDLFMVSKFTSCRPLVELLRELSVLEKSFENKA